MPDWREQLAELEAALADSGQLVCPVCRLVQNAATLTCARCGADVSLLSSLLGEAADRKELLYRAVLAGDTVDALAALDQIAQLTGPSVELAVLRRLLRHGTVPVEVLGDLSPDGPPTADEPLAVYDLPEPTASPLSPTPDPELDAERAVYASLWHEPEEAEPVEPPLGAAAPSPPSSELDSAQTDPTALPEPVLLLGGEGAAAPSGGSDVPSTGSAHVAAAPSKSSPGRFEWLWAVIALLAMFAVGAAVGRLSLSQWPQSAPSVQSIPWKMAPQPDAKP